MPWSKVDGSEVEACKTSQVAVVKDGDGSVEGCHDSNEDADAQLAALRATKEMADIDDLSVGDKVEWSSQGDRTARGVVTQVNTESELDVPDSDFTLNPPAVLIRVMEPTAEGHRPTGDTVGHKPDTLSSIDFEVADDVEMADVAFADLGERLLARAGTTISGQELTEGDLRDIASTFNDVGRAPLTFGHPSSQEAPKAGNVTSVRVSQDGKRLYGRMKPLDDVAELVGRGFYDDRSVGVGYSDDGSAYLHHVALLGGVPPEIKDMPSLSGLEFSAGEEVATQRYADTPLTSLLRPLARRAVAQEEELGGLMDLYGRIGEEAGRSKSAIANVFAGVTSGEGLSEDVFEAIAEHLPVTTDTIMALTGRTDTTQDSDTTMSDSNDEPTREELQSRIDQLEKRLDESSTTDFSDSEVYQEMNRELTRLREQTRESEVESVRSAAEGKMPAEAVDAFADVARSLPDSVETRAFADDDEEEEVSPRRRLAGALRQLPEQVESGRLDLSDVESNGEDKKDLAGEM